MARLPYADLSHPEARPLVDRIVAERGSVLHLYQMLLHSPAVAGGWLNYLTSIRQLSTLPGDIRELVIMRVAAVNGAPYEADQHAPIALKEGLSQAQLDALPEWEASTLFSERERAVLALSLIHILFAGIVVLTAFALVLDYIVGIGEKRLMKWQPKSGETEKL